MPVQPAHGAAAGRELVQHFVFTGDVNSLPSARDAVMEFVQQHCQDKQVCTDIVVALQEGLANAMLHGSQNDPGKSVHCTVEVTPTAFRFSIQDCGPGFDTASVAGPLEDGTNQSLHGRGIMMIRSLMDEVTYARHGSELRMTKLRRSSE